LVIIVSNRVVLLLEGIEKSQPSGFGPKNCRLISEITISFPPIFDMGKGFKECEGDFTVGNILGREITIFPKRRHLSGLQIKEYKN
jgi:hypothetical protein